MATIETQRLVVEPGEWRGKSWDGLGLGVIFKIYGEETGGRLAVVEHPVGPRILVPPHLHESEDEYSFILEGTIGARIGDRILEAAAGSYVFKPQNVPHTFWNPTDKPARILEMIAPTGFEKFFEEMGGLLQSGVRPDERPDIAEKYQLRMLPEWVPELKAKYNLRLLGES